VVFTLFFVVFSYYRGHDVALYERSQATLNQSIGAVNTVLMLTGSWFVALAVQAGRRLDRNRTRARLALAFACAVGFIALKVVEYSQKISAGITLETNEFYMYYFVFTGIHLVHVCIGMGVLAVMWTAAPGNGRGGSSLVLLESGASFWHLVDILWIFLFALLYLMK
jgi:nitric oxide reductase NorE protein